MDARARRGTLPSVAVGSALLLATLVSAPQPVAGATAAAREAAPLTTPSVTIRIPAFSRKYRTSCSTCHVAPGKLNSQGEAFRLNGYRFPDDYERMRGDDPIPLGAEPWKDLWPRAVWPGEIPGALPISVHAANDLRIARGSDGRVAAELLAPSVSLHAGTTLGDGISAFVKAGWRQGSSFQLGEARVMLQDVLPLLPPRALNLWVGLQSPRLLTFADPGIDRVARRTLLWQGLRLADWELENPAGNALASTSTFRLGGSRPGLELNGLYAGRLYYGAGLSQTESGGAEEGQPTDAYFKLRYKVGGMGLDGRLPSGDELPAWGGQLLDRGVTVESFAYFGESRLESGARDEHRSFGIAARVTGGRGDFGIGRVDRRHALPWGAPGLDARFASTFARGEFLLYPWVIASLKADDTEVRASADAPDDDAFAPLRRARVLPALVLLVRHNVRVIAEGEFFLKQTSSRASDGAGRPHAVWLGLDVAF